MAKKVFTPSENGKAATVHDKSSSRALAVSERGIRTGPDFASFMSALMGDIVAGRVSPGVGNAACNAGGKMLKVVAMQLEHGTRTNKSKATTLLLTSDNSA